MAFKVGVFSLQSATTICALLGLAVWRRVNRQTCAKHCKGMRSHLEAVIGVKCAEVIVVCTQWWFVLSIVLLVDLGFTYQRLQEMRGIDDQVSTAGIVVDPYTKSWLKTFAGYTFPGCALTYLLAGVAIGRQIVAATKEVWHNEMSWMLSHQRDVALQVLFMPPVYHLMMCRCVLRQFSARSHIHLSDLEGISVKNEDVRTQIELQIAETSVGVAEVYDAYALLCFGTLALHFVKPHMEILGQDHSTHIGKVLSSSVLLGVQMYVITAVTTAVYHIVIVVLTFALDQPVCVDLGLPSLEHNATKTFFESGSGLCTFDLIVYGANFATSTIAIYNLIFFETTLHHEIEDFHPALKFWGMKIPVTLAFSISLLKAVQPFTGLDDEQVDLLNSSVKALCMTITAFLNIFAWKADEKWYERPELRDDRDDLVDNREVTAGSGCCGVFVDSDASCSAESAADNSDEDAHRRN
eukprot:TRINITY_DN8107_c0_g2_i1.p1 TRINITY_DN8107_c0_g2~~TRINITY_DN8107_c0_g2_i1.p1  ORF type:complete len:485 (-),score=68.08 TRINITY_DN8107_c0_g2_i1:39-1439(-)